MAKLIDLMTKREYKLPNKKIISIGRSRDNDIPLPDRGYLKSLKELYQKTKFENLKNELKNLEYKSRLISRNNHFQIINIDNEYFIRFINGINPIYLNKEKNPNEIKQINQDTACLLEDNDTLSIGYPDIGYFLKFKNY